MLKDYDRALVWIEDRFRHSPAAGRYAYWTALLATKLKVGDVPVEEGRRGERTAAVVRVRALALGSEADCRSQRGRDCSFVFKIDVAEPGDIRCKQLLVIQSPSSRWRPGKRPN